MILLYSKDLFFVPVVRGAAEARDLPVVLIAGLDDEKLSALDSERVLAVLLDLGAISREELSSLYAGLAQKFPAATLCAFGSHVHAAKLSEARAAGFEPVLSRGQIHGQLPEYLQQWLNGTD